MEETYLKHVACLQNIVTSWKTENRLSAIGFMLRTGNRVQSLIFPKTGGGEYPRKGMVGINVVSTRDRTQQSVHIRKIFVHDTA